MPRAKAAAAKKVTKKAAKKVAPKKVAKAKKAAPKKAAKKTAKKATKGKGRKWFDSDSSIIVWVSLILLLPKIDKLHTLFFFLYIFSLYFSVYSL